MNKSKEFYYLYVTQLIDLHTDFIKIDLSWSSGLENIKFLELYYSVFKNKLKLLKNLLTILENSHKIIEKKYINSLANLMLIDDYTNYISQVFNKRIQDNIVAVSQNIYSEISKKQKTEQDFQKKFAVKRKFKKFVKQLNNPYKMTPRELYQANAGRFVPENIAEYISLPVFTDNLLNTKKYWQYFLKVPDFLFPFLPADHILQQYSYFRATGVGVNLVTFESANDDYNYVLDNVAIPWHTYVVDRNSFMFTPFILTNITSYCLKYFNDPLIYTPEYVAITAPTLPLDFGNKFIYPFKEKGTKEPIAPTISNTDYLNEIQKYNPIGYKFLETAFEGYDINILHLEIFTRAYDHQFDSILLMNEINFYDRADYTHGGHISNVFSYRF